MNEFHHISEICLHYDLMLLVLRHFLDRTRGQPFSFRLNVPYFRQDEGAVYLLELLVAESPRWQEAYFETLSALSILCRAKHRIKHFATRPRSGRHA